jgi:hypothetical protein
MPKYPATNRTTTTTPMMVKMLMPPSFHCDLVSSGFHHAFTLVDGIRPAHWTLGKLWAAED